MLVDHPVQRAAEVAEHDLRLLVVEDVVAHRQDLEHPLGRCHGIATGRARLPGLDVNHVVRVRRQLRPVPGGQREDPEIVRAASDLRERLDRARSPRRSPSPRGSPPPARRGCPGRPAARSRSASSLIPSSRGCGVCVVRWRSSRYTGCPRARRSRRPGRRPTKVWCGGRRPISAMRSTGMTGKESGACWKYVPETRASTWLCQRSNAPRASSDEDDCHCERRPQRSCPDASRIHARTGRYR